MHDCRAKESQDNCRMPIRQYRHVRNTDHGIHSLCLWCETVVASVDDEWSLLDHEQRHVCRSNSPFRISSPGLS
jgi:hypothetical protein